MKLTDEQLRGWLALAERVEAAQAEEKKLYDAGEYFEESLRHGEVVNAVPALCAAVREMAAEGGGERDPGDEEGAPGETGEEAAPATPQPGKKPAQSKRDDTRYATARKEADEKRRAAEAEKSGMQAKMDSFARSYGYDTFAAMEQAEQVRRYVESGMPAAQELAQLRQELNDAKERAESAASAFGRQGLYSQLLEEFPDAWGMRDLPQEVYDAVDAGETPVNAYRAWENRQLKDRLQAQNDRLLMERDALAAKLAEALQVAGEVESV